MTARLRAWRWLALTLTLTAVAACNDAAPSQSAPATASPTLPPPSAAASSTTTTTVDPNHEVLAAYEQSWQIFAEAMRALDPAGLEAAFTGSALATVRNQVTEQQARGRPVAVKVTHNPRVLQLEGDQAIVEDRYRNQSVELDPATGQPLSPVTPQEVREQRSLQQGPDGTWRVSFITRFEEEPR